MLAEKLYKMTLNNLKTLAENLALPLLRQVALTKRYKKGSIACPIAFLQVDQPYSTNFLANFISV